MSSFLKYLLILGCWLSIAVSQTAHAMQCSLQTAGVNFGIYDVFANKATDSVGNLLFKCVGVPERSNIASAISLNQGHANSFQRFLMSKNQKLFYNLYTDPTRQQIWGDGTAGTAVYNLPHFTDGMGQRIIIYARIPAHQNVEAGSYEDQLVATVTF